VGATEVNITLAGVKMSIAMMKLIMARMKLIINNQVVTVLEERDLGR